jgi:hypothetical protein
VPRADHPPDIGEGEAGAEQLGRGSEEADGEHGEGGLAQHEDEDDRGDGGEEARAEDHLRMGAIVISGHRMRGECAAEQDRDADRRDHGSGDRDREHFCREGSAGAPTVGVEHQEVGQVRAGQEERGRVGHEDAAVEERLDPDPAPAGGEDQHRGEEDDGGVEVEDRGHHRVEQKRRAEQRQTAARQRLQPRPAPGEEPVAVGEQADQEQPRDQDEWRPGLFERCRHRRVSTRSAPRQAAGLALPDARSEG